MSLLFSVSSVLSVAFYLFGSGRRPGCALRGRGGARQRRATPAAIVCTGTGRTSAQAKAGLDGFVRYIPLLSPSSYLHMNWRALGLDPILKMAGTACGLTPSKRGGRHGDQSVVSLSRLGGLPCKHLPRSIRQHSPRKHANGHINTDMRISIFNLGSSLSARVLKCL